MSSSSPLSRRSVLLLISINALWGGSSLVGKIALDHVPPMTLAFARFSVSALLLFLITGYRRVNLNIARRDWLLFWEIGALGIALAYVCTYSGLRLTTAADSALIHAAEPVFLAILSVVMLREKLRSCHLGAIGLGLAGVLLIVSRGGHALHFNGAVGGDLLIALGLWFEALSVILGKRLIARYPPLTVLTYQMLSGAVLLAPCAVAEGIGGHWQPPAAWAAWPTVGSFVYLVLLCTIFAYTVWFLLLNRHSASSLSAFLYIQPVFGAALGIVFQHDTLTLATVIGAILVLLALALIQRPALEVEPLPAA